jgi:DNA modification methylase
LIAPAGQTADQPPFLRIRADARHLPLSSASVDLIVTSPPYWKKRDYGHGSQIGQETTVQKYVAQIALVLTEMRRVLRPGGSLFLNVGDNYHRKSLMGVPGRIEVAALDAGWTLRNRIIWAKPAGLPTPVRNRLVNRHETILHLVRRKSSYFYDLQGYVEHYGEKPSDVWNVALRPNSRNHLAPFPPELVERSITLACPEDFCTACGEPRQRLVRRTGELCLDRQQARRAVELAEAAGLSDAHFAAIRATGITDAGKAQEWQNLSNNEEVKRLAAEAKAVLGGYFREFTFPRWETAGFVKCECGAPRRRAVVLDPFCGSGTALHTATEMGRAAIGCDLMGPEAYVEEDPKVAAET